jgi:CheY-like chemotaxis protein
MPLTVLIVEDNVDAADSLAELLRLCGHEARVARNGEEAVEAAVRHPIDAIALDIVLPDTDGYTAAKRLRAALGRRPLLIAVTGFDHHFAKPVDPS